MKMLRNKKGFSYILTCVLVLAVVMMIAVSVQYSLVFSLVRSEKETSTELWCSPDGAHTKFACEGTAPPNTPAASMMLWHTSNML